MTAASLANGLAQEFRIVFPPKVKIKNNMSSVYLRRLRLYGTLRISHYIPNISNLVNKSFERNFP